MKTRFLLTLFSLSGQWRIIMTLASLALIIAANIFVTMYTATLWGAYVALALPLGLMWINIVFMWASLARYTKRARLVVSSGLYPQQEFAQVSGLYVCVFLAVLPGLFSLILSWLVYIAPIRILIGTLITKKFKTDFEIVYEELQTED